MNITLVSERPIAVQGQLCVGARTTCFSLKEDAKLRVQRMLRHQQCWLYCFKALLYMSHFINMPSQVKIAALGESSLPGLCCNKNSVSAFKKPHLNQMAQEAALLISKLCTGYSSCHGISMFLYLTNEQTQVQVETSANTVSPQPLHTEHEKHHIRSDFVYSPAKARGDMRLHEHWSYALKQALILTPCSLHKIYNTAAQN